MKRLRIEPEVAGELGPGTIMITEKHPPNVLWLHFRLTNWSGDGIVECFPCFIATSEAVAALSRVQATGYEARKLSPRRSCDTLGGTESEGAGVIEFDEDATRGTNPEWYWLNIRPQNSDTDLSTDTDGRLIVTSKALEALREVGLRHASIVDVSEA